jgi:ABC-type lipoprotein release transport system permease subunit
MFRRYLPLILKNSWRNVRRNRRRSLITAASVGFGLMLSVIFTGSADYAYTNMIDAAAAMGMGHVTVAAAGFNDSLSLSRPLSGLSGIRAAARAAGAEAVRIRIMGQAVFAAGSRSAGGMVMGVDPAAEDGAHNLFLRNITAGRVLRPGERGGAVVGAELARRLRLVPGRRLVYTVSGKNGMVSGVARVRGIFRTGAAAADKAVVILPLADLRETAGYGPDEAGLAAVFLADQRQSGLARAILVRHLAGRGVEVLTWRRTRPSLAALIAMDRAGDYVMQGFVWLLIAAGIFNTMQMSVFERRRQFGIMQALGMAPAAVFFMIAAESVWIAMLGLGLGAAALLPLYWYMSSHGLDLSALVGQGYSAAGVVIDPLLRVRIFPEKAAAIVALLLLVVFLSSLWPAAAASRLGPLAAMRRR